MSSVGESVWGSSMTSTPREGGGFTKKDLRMWIDVDAKKGGRGLNGICGPPQEKNINF